MISKNPYNKKTMSSDGTRKDLGSSSINSKEGYNFIKGATVASPDTSVKDAIESLRNNLAEQKELPVGNDGTIYNPSDPAAMSSINNSDGYNFVKGATVAKKQWYENNPRLKEREIQAMMQFKPEARLQVLPNGKLAWAISFNPIVCGRRKNWTVLAVYDSDHPKKRWGGSVKIYPVKPDYKEMQEMVQKSFVTPKRIPHMLSDETNQMYMCTNDVNKIDDGTSADGAVTSAAACLRYAMRWITVFELGLIDQKTWDLFQQHGKI